MNLDRVLAILGCGRLLLDVDAPVAQEGEGPPIGREARRASMAASRRQSRGSAPAIGRPS